MNITDGYSFINERKNVFKKIEEKTKTLLLQKENVSEEMKIEYIYCKLFIEFFNVLYLLIDLKILNNSLVLGSLYRHIEKNINTQTFSLRIKKDTKAQNNNMNNKKLGLIIILCILAIVVIFIIVFIV